MPELVLDDIGPGLTLAEMVDELNTLGGLDLTTVQAHRLLNEGNRELTVRGEWRRAELELGPTVAGQESYEVPNGVARIRKLYVNGRQFVPIDEAQATKLKLNDLLLRSYGAYWLSFQDAVESVSLYPAPSTADLPIMATVALYPPDLIEDEQEPIVPNDYRRAIVDYAAALAYGYQEDNPELRVFHMDEFDKAVAKLRRHRYTRGAAGPVQMRVTGYTA
jgi:hypothetical protein